jgi:alanine dehydrogenase
LIPFSTGRKREGIIHYAVSNMPEAVPRTSTCALMLNNLPYVLEIMEKGWKKAARENLSSAKGVNLSEGKITYKAVAQAFNLPYTSHKRGFIVPQRGIMLYVVTL